LALSSLMTREAIGMEGGPVDPTGKDDDPVIIDRIDSLEHLYPRLRRFAAVVAPDDIDPDDLLHEAFMRVAQARGLDQFSGMEPYLRTTMVNLVRKHAKRRPIGERVRRLVGGADHAPAADTGATILDHLSPEDRVLLFLVDVEGASYGEAADVLGVNPAAARKRAERARSKLRSELEAGD
jgi:RNA polymerase sigma-70 factor, ECF subfamily